MVARILLSEWFGLLQASLMAFCLAIAVHEVRASSPPEHFIAFS